MPTDAIDQFEKVSPVLVKLEMVPCAVVAAQVCLLQFERRERCLRVRRFVKVLPVLDTSSMFDWQLD